MPSTRPKSCKRCGEHESIAGRISWAGNCPRCGDQRLQQARREMRSHTGETFGVWRRSMAACVGAALADEQLGA